MGQPSEALLHGMHRAFYGLISMTVFLVIDGVIDMSHASPSQRMLLVYVGFFPSTLQRNLLYIFYKKKEWTLLAVCLFGRLSYQFYL